MKNPFYKEYPLVEPHYDKPVDKTPKLKKLANKAGHFANDHPLVPVAIALTTVHVICYGALGYVEKSSVPLKETLNLSKRMF